MSDIDEATGVPEPARVESWLRTLTGFEDARVVVAVVAAHRRPVERDLPSEAYRRAGRRPRCSGSSLRTGSSSPTTSSGRADVLNHLAGAAVPVPGVLASESDPRFFGAPFLLLESIDAAHMPAPEADFATFAADLPAFAAAVAAIHALDWRAAGLDFLGVPSSACRSDSRARSRAVARRMSAFGCADEPLLNRALTRRCWRLPRAAADWRCVTATPTRSTISSGASSWSGSLTGSRR